MSRGMSVALRIGCTCLLCLALAACGSSSRGSSDRQQITQVFTGLESAMAKGDYAGACARLSHRQQSNVVSGAKRLGLSVSDCAGAFSALIQRAGVSKAQLAKAFGAGQAPKVRSVVIHGNQATVTYSAASGGQTFTETDGLVKENGAWKADRTINRHNGS
jgi:hypothetical protein